MKVYAACERQDMTLDIAPGAHIGDRTACPMSWFDEEGRPLNFTVHFRGGEAEVTDEIGRYLTAYKMARKTRLILPALVV